jgi:hypothetical protein
MGVAPKGVAPGGVWGHKAVNPEGGQMTGKQGQTLQEFVGAGQQGRSKGGWGPGGRAESSLGFSGQCGVCAKPCVSGRVRGACRTPPPCPYLS